MREGAQRDRRGGHAGRRLDDITGALLVACVALAPVPVASARPVFWMLWTAVLGAALAAYMIAMLLADPRRRLGILGLWPVLLPALALPAFGLVQAVAGGPLALTDLPGGAGTVVGTLAPGATLIGVLRLLGLFALFTLVCEVAVRARRVTAMAWGLFAAVFLHAVWGLAALAFFGDIALWGEKTAYLGAATGPFINRNAFANFLGMGLVTGVALVLSRASRPPSRRPGIRALVSETALETACLWLLVAIVAVALIATGSRMGVLASAVAVLVVCVLMWAKRDLRAPGAALWAGVVALVTLVAVAGRFAASLLERGVFAAPDATIRTELYAQILGMIAARPVSGTGLDTFAPAYELVHDDPVSSAYVWRLAHSSYLTLWSEMGLIAGSLPMLAVAMAAWRLLRIIRRGRTDYAVPVAAFGVIVLAALHATVDFSLEIEANLMLFLALVGLGLGRLGHRGREGKAG